MNDDADIPENGIGEETIQGGNGKPDESQRLMQELEAARQEAGERLEQLLRCRADMENLLRRTAREKEEMARFATEGLIKKLLGFVDSMEQAAKHDEGSRILNQQLWGILSSEGLEPIEAAGQKFDPYLHEAMMQMESCEVEEGCVAMEFQKGYSLHSKVIRTSKVAVARHSK
ncbi:MAG: heat shock protein GrpE [Methanosaeta sp. PtaB.Bin039]|nr:MAG: heat shock protein GrpE [Methanosaeta sp. PtaB.Bin039]OPY45876.1 MAG: heat shock protein GrpE [Methanosaeta sp. PtaU1.Bin028]HOT07828.1 nucleotide exchange factor GrpE [Methanotrichaceae archaeon]HQF17539.1 nucleotide exchange factor GrpE [Methanotrichaceae archaeon]HQI92119.1 nucleotide exchange factor GrpE [Methanotrichaceae archaeon]